jgi:hypothetical protein
MHFKEKALGLKKAEHAEGGEGAVAPFLPDRTGRPNAWNVR